MSSETKFDLLGDSHSEWSATNDGWRNTAYRVLAAEFESPIPGKVVVIVAEAFNNSRDEPEIAKRSHTVFLALKSAPKLYEALAALVEWTATADCKGQELQEIWADEFAAARTALASARGEG